MAAIPTAGVLAAVVLLSGLVAPLPQRPITFYGIGPVRVGATVRSASRAAGAPLLGGAGEAAGGDGCRHVHLKAAPSMLFMVEGGRIVRVETRDRRFRTASGARVGDSEATVRRLYGRRLDVTPHKYDEGGHYFIVRSSDRRYAMVMETDGKKVVFIRSGLVPAAEYVEGCG